MKAILLRNSFLSLSLGVWLLPSFANSPLQIPIDKGGIERIIQEVQRKNNISPNIKYVPVVKSSLTQKSVSIRYFQKEKQKEGEPADYPLGEYRLSTSKAAMALVEMLKLAAERELKALFESDAGVEVTIYSSTDNYRLKKGKTYDGGLGEIANLPYQMAGRAASLTLQTGAKLQRQRDVSVLRTVDIQNEIKKSEKLNRLPINFTLIAVEVPERNAKAYGVGIQMEFKPATPSQLEELKKRRKKLAATAPKPKPKLQIEKKKPSVNSSPNTTSSFTKASFSAPTQKKKQSTPVPKPKRVTSSPKPTPSPVLPKVKTSNIVRYKNPETDEVEQMTQEEWEERKKELAQRKKNESVKVVDPETGEETIMSKSEWEKKKRTFAKKKKTDVIHVIDHNTGETKTMTKQEWEKARAERQQAISKKKSETPATAKQQSATFPPTTASIPQTSWNTGGQPQVTGNNKLQPPPSWVQIQNPMTRAFETIPLSEWYRRNAIPAEMWGKVPTPQQWVQMYNPMLGMNETIPLNEWYRRHYWNYINTQMQPSMYHNGGHQQWVQVQNMQTGQAEIISLEEWYRRNNIAMPAVYGGGQAITYQPQMAWGQPQPFIQEQPIAVVNPQTGRTEYMYRSAWERRSQHGATRYFELADPQTGRKHLVTEAEWHRRNGSFSGTDEDYYSDDRWKPSPQRKYVQNNTHSQYGHYNQYPGRRDSRLNQQYNQYPYEDDLSYANTGTEEERIFMRGKYYVVFGAFKDQGNALRYKSRLASKGKRVSIMKGDRYFYIVLPTTYGLYSDAAAAKRSASVGVKSWIYPSESNTHALPYEIGGSRGDKLDEIYQETRSIVNLSFP